MGSIYTIAVKPFKPNYSRAPLNESGDATGGLITLGRSILTNNREEKLKTQAGIQLCWLSQKESEQLGVQWLVRQLLTMNCHIMNYGSGETGQLTRVVTLVHIWGHITRELENITRIYLCSLSHQAVGQLKGQILISIMLVKTWSNSIDFSCFSGFTPK